MVNLNASLIKGFAEFWPREIFDLRRGKKGLLLDELKKFEGPGVYVLYRDDEPYYIGKSQKNVLSRLHKHANVSGGRYSRHWNYFSVFMVKSEESISDIEGILIAAVPKAANGAKTRMPKISLLKETKSLLSMAKRIYIDKLKGV